MQMHAYVCANVWGYLMSIEGQKKSIFIGAFNL